MRKIDRRHCSCICHHNPNVKHVVPCCTQSGTQRDPIQQATIQQAADVYAAEMKDLYIETLTGKQFYLDRSPFDIDDIAGALSKLCRFNGHCSVIYTVAEHSILVANIMRYYALGDPFEGLLHDGTEAYLADIPSPWKVLLPQYKKIELGLEARLREQFGLSTKITNGCKRADYIALFVEAQALIPTKGVNWPAPDGIKEQAAEYARNGWLIRSDKTYDSDQVSRAFLREFGRLKPQ